MPCYSLSIDTMTQKHIIMIIQNMDSNVQNSSPKAIGSCYSACKKEGAHLHNIAKIPMWLLNCLIQPFTSSNHNTLCGLHVESAQPHGVELTLCIKGTSLGQSRAG